MTAVCSIMTWIFFLASSIGLLLMVGGQAPATDNYILKVSVDCGASEKANNPVLSILTDVAISAKAKCLGGYQSFTTTDRVHYILPAALTAGSKCRLKRRENSDTYAIDIGVHYGEVGNLILTKKKIVTAVCTFSDYGKDASPQQTIIDGPIAPIEMQRIIGSTIAGKDLKLAIQTVDNKDVKADLNMNRKYSVLGTYTGSRKNVGLKPVSCDAIAPNGDRYSVLRAGCGDGLIFPRKAGFMTTGQSFRSPYFEAFHLGTSDSLSFDCNVTLCTDCDGSSCETYCGQVTSFKIANGGLTRCNGNNRLKDTCQFNCDSGYKQSGNGVSSCGPDGIWTVPAILCTAKDCGKPPAGTAASVSATATTFGYKATYACNPGYERYNGSTSISCLSNGAWDMSRTLHCRAKNCGRPPKGKSSTFLAPVTTYPNRATYLCDPGYERQSGSYAIACLSTGAWNLAQVLNCRAKNCGKPKIIANGRVSAPLTTYPNIATYTCNTGYQSSSSLTVQCLSSGKWSTKIPTCGVNNCGAPPKPNGSGTVVAKTTLYKSTAVYTCSTGYIRTKGFASISCLATGKWDTAKKPTCTPKNCGKPPKVANAIVLAPKTTYGSKASYRCKTNYYHKEGNVAITCLSTGKWNTKSLTVCGRISSCADIKSCRSSYTSDREYWMYPKAYNGVSTKLYCRGMRTVAPKEYLTLRYPNIFTYPNGYYKKGSNCKGFLYNTASRNRAGTTAFTKVRINALYMTIIDNDYTFTRTSGKTKQAYGKASACSIYDTRTCPKRGKAEMNMAGTGLIFSTANKWKATGWIPYMVMKSRTSTKIVVNGDGGCGSAIPTAPLVLLPNPNTRLRPASTTAVKPAACYMKYNLKDCGAPPKPKGPGKVVSKTTHYGSAAVYTCSIGYEITKGSATIHCLATGKWDTSKTPTCTIKNCGKPKIIANSRVAAPLTTYPNIATYTCNPGYQSSGPLTVQCLSSGKWSTKIPTCGGKNCGPPPKPNGSGTVVAKTTLFKSTAVYTCSTGYTRTKGSASISCLVTGKWDTAKKPTCTIKNCGKPPTVANAIVLAPKTTYGSKASYRCSTNYYHKEGHVAITCLSTGKWNTKSLTVCGRISSCADIKSCRSSYTSDREYWMYPKAYKGVSARLYCRGMRTVAPKEYLTLRFRNRFIFPNGYYRKGSNCKRFLYNTASLNRAGTTTFTKVRINALYMTIIDNDYTFSKTLGKVKQAYGKASACSIYETRTCPKRGVAEMNLGSTGLVFSTANKWKATGWIPFMVMKSRTPTQIIVNGDGGCGSAIPTAPLILLPNPNTKLRPASFTALKPPSCFMKSNLKDCGAPPKLNGPGKVVSKTTHYGSAAVYTCSIGYEITKGSATIYCLATGKWDTSKTPTCTIKNCGKLPKVANAVLRAAKTTYGSRASYTCSTNYFHVKGTATITCLSTGKWATSLPVCARISSCADIKSCRSSYKDGEYWTYPKAYKGRPVKVYCNGLKTSAPKEYVTLPNLNRFSHPNGYYRKGSKCKNFVYNTKTFNRAGITTFTKVRINAVTMTIINNDYTFSKTTLAAKKKQPYGTANACSIYDTRTCPKRGTAEMNLGGTGLIFSGANKWKATGWIPYMVMKSRTSTKIIVNGDGGCGSAVPTAPLILLPNPNTKLRPAVSKATTPVCLMK